jgi:acetyl esterase/lipase
LGRDGRITIERPEPDWEARMDEWSFAGLLNATYAYAEFVVPKTCRALATITHVSAFRLNGAWFPGAPYSGGPSTVPVLLNAGRNRVLLRMTGYGSTTWGTFLLSPVQEPVWVDAKDAVLPDLVKGRDLDAPIGVPVWNTTNRWTGRKPAVSIRIPWDRFTRSAVLGGESKDIPLVIAVRPQSRGARGARGGPSARSMAAPDTLRVHLRDANESHRVSFISRIDGSAQFYATLPPSGPGSRAPFAMILTLHGAGVDALNQVRSYAPKSWAYVVAPTNRRPFGFDWQDWGRRDALEVLDLALKTYPIDPDRIMLTGHSMGGHGTWAVGVQHHDRFAALAPSAGWSHFDLYVPMTLRRSSLLANPERNALWHRMRIGDRVPLFLRNLLRVPVLVLHGGADDNVPPTHGRFLASQLAGQGGRVTYLEVPGKGHWWDEDDDRPGVACVDHPEIMKLFRSAKREHHPSSVEFRLADLTVDGGRRHWVEILEQHVPLRESYVRARVTGWDHLEITTRNVAALLLNTERWARSGIWDVTIDGRLLRARGQGELILQRTGSSGSWKAVATGTHEHQRLLSRPETRKCHGLKSAFLSPFILVYGASGTPDEAAAALGVARSLARTWTYRGNGDAPILSDRQALALLRQEQPQFEGGTLRNLIMIGNESSNALLKQWSTKLDVRVKRDVIEAPATWEWVETTEGDLAGRPIVSGGFLGDVSIAALIENPMLPGRVTAIYGGTSGRAIERSIAAQPFFSGAGWPDVVVFDEELQEKGWAGLRGAAIRRSP